MDVFAWQNIHNAAVSLSAAPSKKLKAQLDYHLFWIATPATAGTAPTAPRSCAPSTAWPTASPAPKNGRLCNFYSNAPYTGNADRTLVEKSVTAWRNAVVAANPRLAGPEAKPSIFRGSLKMGIIGGVIGGLVVAIKMMVAKKKSVRKS